MKKEESSGNGFGGHMKLIAQGEEDIRARRTVDQKNLFHRLQKKLYSFGNPKKNASEIQNTMAQDC